MKIRRSRQEKRVLREVRTSDGKHLRVVAYRVPEPGYRGDGCGVGPITAAHPDDLLEGTFAAAVESDVFAAILDRIAGGLGKAIREDAALEVGPNLFAGARLGAFLMHVQRIELMPMLLRASEIRTTAAAATFVAAWHDPARQAAMQQVARKLLTRRDCDAEQALAREMHAFGLPLNHKPVVGKDGKAIAEAESMARQQLRRVIGGSARVGGGG